MRPYYEHAGVTIYHGRCEDVLPIADVWLLLTDPPYGMRHEPTRRGDGSKRWGSQRIVGDDTDFDPAHLLCYPKVVLWGAHWYANRLPASGGWIVWDKTPRGRKKGFTASDCDLAWTNTGGTVQKFALQWGGEARDGEPHLHPTQKPVALMRWLVERYSEPGALVLDPYMGSGPVAQACSESGRRYVGVEVEERYCEAAASRLSQQRLDLGAA